MNKAIRTWGTTLRIPDVLRRIEPQNVTPAPPPKKFGFAHRADMGGAAAASDTLTRLAVVLLSTVNAVMWEVYTESRFMALVWAGIAVGFAIWMKRDAANR